MTRTHMRFIGFWRDERANPTLEFVIMFPVMVFFLLSSVELGFITMRHTMLERAVDMTVRDIRLGTGSAPQHSEIKTQICDTAAMIPDCNDNLRVEMIQIDPRNWVAPDPTPDCTDQSKEVKPVRTFENGQENQMMVIRVCVKYQPLFPLTGLGDALTKDGAGYAAMVSSTAFVQEPL
ncbi:MAG: pilus assembly protein [Sediminimonas qiaohouensis]|uniref:Pilus assembly protein n=1 Tax=Sediminimonas qiaohouensis TaxID=552061 RepID=A0A7C9LMH2_9RHOB|nr:TadE/TadG family type IV pilus assembly protein [Sediminimonas qiaohouensis]MTJ04022.1 pilus assembly protein [Sediminimonas qiaohouensis]